MSELSRDPDVNWRDNRIQFPRLIAELEALGVFSDSVLHDLSVEMDLPVPAICELIDRAQKDWDEIKQCTLKKYQSSEVSPEP